MSIFGDFFEQFRRRTEHRIPMDIPQNILNDLYNDSLKDGQRKEPEYSDRHSTGTFFDNPTDVMSEFEEMFNNFFKGFPVMAFPLPNGNEMPSLPEHEDMCDNNSTLQERMLIDKKQSHRRSSQFPFSADRLKRPEKESRIIDDEPVVREDRNLDEDLKAGERSLDDILPRGDVHRNTPAFSVSGSFTSSSVTRNSNGVVERKKTVRDSRGNEQVTITRRIGGKEYTVTHKTDEDGNKKTIENVVELGAPTGKNRPEMLTPEPCPERSRITSCRPPSLYARLRTWFFSED